jgi:hypothetical protein
MNLSVDPPTSTTINTDEEEVKLPSISFGYHCGRGLTTMHTSIMLMLSGSFGDGLVECVRNKTIERTLDLSESLLLDPDQYSRHLSTKKYNFIKDFEMLPVKKLSR